jgi:hypothetical protein
MRNYTIKVRGEGTTVKSNVEHSVDKPTPTQPSQTLKNTAVKANALAAGAALYNGGKSLVTSYANVLFNEKNNKIAANRFNLGLKLTGYSIAAAVNPLAVIGLGFDLASTNLNYQSQVRREDRQANYTRNKYGIESTNRNRGER